jgi:hypothetical protein
MNNLKITVNINPSDDIETGMINAVGELMGTLSSHHIDSNKRKIETQVRVLNHCLTRAKQGGY